MNVPVTLTDGRKKDEEIVDESTPEQKRNRLVLLRRAAKAMEADIAAEHRIESDLAVGPNGELKEKD